MKKTLILFLLFLANKLHCSLHEENDKLKQISHEIQKHLPQELSNIVMGYHGRPLIFYNINDRASVPVASFFACFYRKDHPKEAFKQYLTVAKLIDELPDKKGLIMTHLLPNSFFEIFNFLNIEKFEKVITVNPENMSLATKLEQHIHNSKNKHCNFESITENISELDLNDADIIYMNSTLFKRELMDELLEKFAKLKKGLIVVTHQELPKNFSEAGFKLIKEFEALRSTWSNDTPVYIYQLN